jgi:hypothetical protein
MKVVNSFAAVGLGVMLVAPAIRAQSISIGVRGTGSIPTGAFADTSARGNDALMAGAKNGFGYGLDVGLGFGPFGIYAGFDHVKFDCETQTCTKDGKYTLEGVTGGLKIGLPHVSFFRPFVKGGVTFKDLTAGYGASSSTRLQTDKTPGYEVGVGADLSFLFGLVSLTPQARYVGSELKAKIPGVITPNATGTGVHYMAFDLGLSVHTPFGR